MQRKWYPRSNLQAWYRPSPQNRPNPPNKSSSQFWAYFYNKSVIWWIPRKDWARNHMIESEHIFMDQSVKLRLREHITDSALAYWLI